MNANSYGKKTPGFGLPISAIHLFGSLLAGTFVAAQGLPDLQQSYDKAAVAALNQKYSVALDRLTASATSCCCLKEAFLKTLKPPRRPESRPRYLPPAGCDSHHPAPQSPAHHPRPRKVVHRRHPRLQPLQNRYRDQPRNRAFTHCRSRRQVQWDKWPQTHQAHHKPGRPCHHHRPAQLQKPRSPLPERLQVHARYLCRPPAAQRS